MSAATTEKNYIAGEISMLFAKTVVEKLRPHCSNIEATGQIRRIKDLHIKEVIGIEVKELAILCTPQYETNIFKEFTAHSPNFLNVINSEGFRRNSDCIGTKPNETYFKRQIPSYPIHIYTAMPLNWGWMLMLTTGGYGFLEDVKKRLRAKGIYADNGTLYQDRAAIYTPDEASIFQLLNMPYVEPSKRV